MKHKSIIKRLVKIIMLLEGEHGWCSEDVFTIFGEHNMGEKPYVVNKKRKG